jgi:large subunit ribosomal protein L17
MRHRKGGHKLSRTSAQRSALLRNLATDLLRIGKLRTTEAKAKAVRPLAEKMVTLAKRGDLHSRRLALRTIRDKRVVSTLFTELAERYQDRDGGYVRIMKLGPRLGDASKMALIELVE